VASSRLGSYFCFILAALGLDAAHISGRYGRALVAIRDVEVAGPGIAKPSCWS
jgi:hypothetical protein